HGGDAGEARGHLDRRLRFGTSRARQECHSVFPAPGRLVLSTDTQVSRWPAARPNGIKSQSLGLRLTFRLAALPGIAIASQVSSMWLKNFWIRSLLVSALSAPVFLTGCAASVGYRSYDPYYRDYHVWRSN